MTRKLPIVLFFAAAWMANAAVIFPTNSTWRYFKGLSEASPPDPALWRTIGFDDSGWDTGPAPFYYENQPGGATSYTGNTLLADMFGGYTCVFLRKTFVVTNVADISELQLYAFSDDGFIAWINGTEVARFNMPAGDIPFDGTASAALTEPVPPQNDMLGNPRAYLVPGTNVITVHAFNASLGGSSDFVIDAALSSTTDTTAPAVANTIPAAGATVPNLTSIEVDFSEDVAGVDAADLLINGNAAASVTPFAPWQYVFQFPQPATGTVQIAWAANHGIHDLAGTPNYFAGGGWSYRLDPNASPPGVMISEFMADNKKTIRDEDGDSSDWIEIFNPTANAVNLAGWALTDNPQNLKEWRFPNVTLPAGGRLLVFASGKDRTNAISQLHANFQLSTGGEFLALVDPATNIVSSFTPSYPLPQPADVSYGRVEGAPEVTGYFTVPTPGGPNSTAGAGFSPKVEFAVNGGTFTTSFPLELQTASSNAAIHFTLDGTVPTDTSALYTGPLNINNTVQVRARSFESGLLPGPLHSESYILLNANVINFTSNLPVLIIHTLGAGSISANAQTFVNMSFYEPDSGKTSLTNASALSTRAALRVRGSSTAGYPKQSWAVEFWDDFNDGKNLSPLGLPGESDWVLYAPNNFEPVLIHNPFIYDLSNQIGRYAPRTRLVEVYLNTSGGAVSSANYNGIYVLEEKIKAGKDRVDIDKLEPENVKSPEVTGGYMMKIDRLDPGDGGFYAAGQGMGYVDPKEEEITLPQRAPQQQYLQNYMDAFGNALSSPDPVAGYPAYVDVDSWIDHHILNVMAFNVDALRLSAYFYKERNGKLFFGPIWDFDRALDSTDGRDSNPRVWRSQSGDLGTDFFNYPWWGEMFNDIDFWQKWIDRWQDLRLDKFSLSNMNALIDSLANTVRQEQPREQSRWGVAPRGGSYQAEVNLMKNWLSSRVNFIDTNFLSKPVFSSNGGPISPGFTLTFTGPAGATLYYTTDGTDPRLSGGGIAPTARVYSPPLTLNANSRVVARAYDPNHHNLSGANNPPLSSPWSGPTAATFVVATPPLVITEIMYHPAPPPPGNTNTADNFEYIELKNIGAGTLNLPGVRLTNGIDYTFTSGSSITSLGAGQAVLLVKNRAAFLTRYPGVNNVAGEYLGNLDNSGERLALVGPMLEPILDFRYENSWYPITDGPGFSLVIVDENAPLNTWSNKFSWRPSGNVNGSPGVVDPAPRNLPRVVINEVLTHTDPPQLDAIELYNAGTNAADIGGWYLTDQRTVPQKFRIPAATILPVNGYVVIDEGQFNANPGVATGFRLDSHGEEVYLYSADPGGLLTGYSDGFAFGAARNGVSFGRYVISTGEAQYPAQLANTLTGPNAGPRVGPVVINEIQYHPVFGGDQFIELKNITTAPAMLYDPNYPTNTWKLNGVGFTFPPNAEIPANGLLLLVGIDPATFRARYGVPAGVPIYGPYDGVLQDGGETLTLQMPDHPDVDTNTGTIFIPYIDVDTVRYDNNPPWPTNTNGAGPSLERLSASAYGNDPINWRASSGSGSPGLENPGSLPVLRIDSVDWSGGPSPVLHVRFTAVAGLTYTLQYRDTLATSSWAKLSDIPAQGVTQSIEVTDPAANSATRYYRVVTPQQP